MSSRNFWGLDQLHISITNFRNTKFILKLSVSQILELTDSNYSVYETANQLPSRDMALTIKSHPTSLIGGIDLHADLDHVTSNG